MAGSIAYAKAKSSMPVLAVSTFPLWYTMAAEYVGTAVVAAAFAFVGAAVRWVYFNTSKKQEKLTMANGLAGLGIAPITAFIFGQFHIPVIEPLLGTMPAESAPMVRGFLIGFLGLIVLGYLLDFIEVLFQKKIGGAK